MGTGIIYATKNSSDTYLSSKRASLLSPFSPELGPPQIIQLYPENLQTKFFVKFIKWYIFNLITDFRGIGGDLLLDHGQN